MLFEQARDAFLMSSGELIKAHTQLAIVGIYSGLPACFGVVQRDGANAWQFLLCGIDDTKGNGIVFTGQCTKWSLQIMCKKV